MKMIDCQPQHARILESIKANAVDIVDISLLHRNPDDRDRDPDN